MDIHGLSGSSSRRCKVRSRNYVATLPGVCSPMADYYWSCHGDLLRGAGQLHLIEAIGLEKICFQNFCSGPRHALSRSGLASSGAAAAPRHHVFLRAQLFHPLRSIPRPLLHCCVFLRSRCSSELLSTLRNPRRVHACYSDHLHFAGMSTVICLFVYPQLRPAALFRRRKVCCRLDFGSIEICIDELTFADSPRQDYISGTASTSLSMHVLSTIAHRSRPPVEGPTVLSACTIEYSNPRSQPNKTIAI